MAHVVSDECLACGACLDTCPVGAISEGDGKMVISDDCIDCGACEDVCPVGAISEAQVILVYIKGRPDRIGTFFFLLYSEKFLLFYHSKKVGVFEQAPAIKTGGIRWKKIRNGKYFSTGMTVMQM